MARPFRNVPGCRSEPPTGSWAHKPWSPWARGFLSFTSGERFLTARVCAWRPPARTRVSAASGAPCPVFPSGQTRPLPGPGTRRLPHLWATPRALPFSPLGPAQPLHLRGHLLREACQIARLPGLPAPLHRAKLSRVPFLPWVIRSAPCHQPGLRGPDPEPGNLHVPCPGQVLPARVRPPH